MSAAHQLELAAEPAIGTARRTRSAKRTASMEVAKPAPAATQLPAVRPPHADSVALMAMIDRAVSDPNFDVAKLRELFAFKKEWDADEARKAFVVAKAAFKTEAKTVTKNKHVSFGSRGGGAGTEYDHATLDNVVDTLVPILAKHGLSHSWDPQQPDGGSIQVTCILTHVQGHIERVTLKAGADNSGSKNSIQQIASTVTYLERYTLLAITGTATKDQDDDARGSVGGLPTINVEQKEELIALFRSTEADIPKFLTYFKIKAVGELPVAQFDQAKALLEEKGKRKGAR